MNFQEINVDETHIRLTCDISNHDLKKFIYSIRRDLKDYILKNQDFLLSLETLNNENENLSEIVLEMYKTSRITDTGPMACVAGTISKMSLDYLIYNGSKYSIVENGGDIALINNKTVLCGIYSNNPILGNDIAFKLKKRKTPLGICTSSGKIGHSISFGSSDCVTVLANNASIADGLATRIANDVVGNTSEDKVTNAVETAENYREFFNGALIISDENVATIGRLPKIIESDEFTVKL